MNQFEHFYDWLNNVAGACTELIDYTSFIQKRNTFIISVIEEARLKTFLNGLVEINPDISITILVQDYVADGFHKSFSALGKVIGWKGRYTNQVLSMFKDELFDAFVFFSDFPINLRDQNFLEIAEGFNSREALDTYCCTIGNDIYRYNNIQMYRQALKVYEDVSVLLDYYLQEKI